MANWNEDATDTTRNPEPNPDQLAIEAPQLSFGEWASELAAFGTQVPSTWSASDD